MNNISARIVTFYTFLILAYTVPVQAQRYQDEWIDSTLRARFGAFGHYTWNLHTARFKELPSVPNCCGQFTGGSGSGFSAGLLMDIPFSRAVGISLRASYTQPSGALFFDQRDDSTVIYQNGNAVQATFRHNLTATLANAGLEVFLNIKPFANPLQDGLNVMVGGRAGYVLQRTYTQNEVITDPQDVSFPETRTRIRNASTGAMPQANQISASVMAGLSYDIPLNAKHTLFLTPEVFASYGLTNVVNGLDWKVHQLRAGLALKIMPEGKRPDTTKPEPPAITPPVEPRPPVAEKNLPPQRLDTLKASVSAVAVEYDGTEYKDITFRVEEFLSDNLRPLLPYVFFDEGSSDIPDRYDRLTSKETRQFHIDHLHNLDVLQTYHHILNIVGARMRKYSYAKLFITGCNDFATSEKGDLDLSQRRAERVRDYLMKTWSIDSTRLVLQARNLSDVPTVMGTSNFPKEVHQENRRVELYSDVYEILEPVRTADTVRTVSPPIIRFRPVVQSTQPIASWSVKAGQNKKMLKEFIGAGSPPEILDWEIAQMQENVPRAPVPMYYDLSVTDITGRTYQTTSGTAKVEQITLQKKRRERIGDKVIDRYRLILFDFDKAAITPLQQRIIAYIKTQIKPESVVNIAGYTDYTNPLDYSQKLSRSRADAAAAALGVDAAEVKGVGKAVLLHDNAIPEGRFYCRTVSIIVETPMNAR
jgi:outer membrane protein OmpA-like peptidoglycan-associated protein